MAMVVIAIMIIGSALFFYWEWQQKSEVMIVKVIDTRTGKGNEYRAYKGEVGDRFFTTLDGRQVSLAETERMESRRAPGQ